MNSGIKQNSYTKKLKDPPCRRTRAAAGGVALRVCHEQGRSFEQKK
jgi:hypothetical protein